MHKQELVQCLKPVPRAVSRETLASVLFEICKNINTPRSLAVWILYESGEFSQLVSLDIDAANYRNAQAFADDYLVTKFLSKYPDFAHAELDPEGVALHSFYEFEEMCRRTNSKFDKLKEDPQLWDPSMRSVFELARRKIAFVLGHSPDLVSISQGFGWGPGANTSSTGSYTSAYIKFQSRLDVTSNSLMMGHCCVNSNPAWVNCQLQTDEIPSVAVSLTREAFNIVRGNEIVFVPKNAKTHRIIAKEPTVNSYLQKGFGNEIRALLRRFAGIDLKDQTTNQKLAKEGSLTGTLATIDLRGASDTIARALVEFLLPSKWYLLLDRIRSKQGKLRLKDGDRWIYYHKFSSMGNACTFELESLIFWALCKACLELRGQEQTLNVYGDDIVVPSDAFEDVSAVIDYAGFEVNTKKSYASGPFRESCGKDYFLGTDVRPIFLKESISNVESIFKLANSIRRYGHRRNLGYGCDYRLYPVWSYLYGRVQPHFQGFKIPDGVGDSGFISNWDEALPTLKRPAGRREGWEGFVYRCITRHPVKQVMRDSHAGYTALLSVIGSEEPLLGHHDLRSATFPKETRSHIHGWCDLGPWV